MMRIDLNCDVGESFGAYKIGEDELVFGNITSANIACGYHAGDHNVMAKTVKIALENGVAIGAHPGFADLQGFGRRYMQTSLDDIYHSVLYQIGALHGICVAHGTKINHVKPHGALYNAAAKDRGIGDAIAKAVSDIDQNLILYGLAGSELVSAGERFGLRVANEVFADRTYQADGTLTSRTCPNALISDPEEAMQQVLLMVKEGKVRAVDGTILSLKADTICVHGDEERALTFVKVLRERLLSEKVQLKAIGDGHE
ncbi:LamB/YcsF family protein [Bacillus solitudinis]|uniref:LamB/YcsF family protein n=1 Tax=Bacillus solitudinis TaxID=2014074 RepID=UPI000C2449B5|nr:5-oxoprolinase subunit PxpA [Bacillus solitudinis]